MTQVGTFCFACGNQVDPRAEFCPKCGVRQRTPEHVDTTPRDVAGKKLAAGLCGIFLGALGIHKFIIGATTAGVIMLIVSTVTFGVGAVPMAIIGLIEGIVYITKTDAEFQQTYLIEKKAWF